MNQIEVENRNLIDANIKIQDENILLKKDIILLARYIAYGKGNKDYIDRVVSKYKDKDIRIIRGMYDYD